SALSIHSNSVTTSFALWQLNRNLFQYAYVFQYSFLASSVVFAKPVESAFKILVFPFPYGPMINKPFSKFGFSSILSNSLIKFLQFKKSASCEKYFISGSMF